MLGALPSEGCACLVPDGAHVLPVRVELDHPTDKAHSIVVSSPNLAVNGYLALVEGYLSELHRDHPKAGCAVVCISADVAPRVMPHAPSIRSRSATRGPSSPISSRISRPRNATRSSPQCNCRRPIHGPSGRRPRPVPSDPRQHRSRSDRQRHPAGLHVEKRSLTDTRKRWNR